MLSYIIFVGWLYNMENKEIAKSDTLSSAEMQTLLLSGFLNEYSIVQVDANIESFKNKIKEIEETKYEKTILIQKIALAFSTIFRTVFALLIPTGILLIIGAVLGLIFGDSFISNAYGNIFFFFVKYLSLPLRFILRVQPNVAFNEYSTGYILLSILLALVQIGIIMGIAIIVASIQMDNDVDKQEQKKQKDIEKINDELNKYIPVADEIKRDIKNNLDEIYSYDQIPEMYHNYESLGMLYGYFACGTALNFQEAAKEYLKDKNTQTIINVMSQTNELLSLIAQKANVFSKDKKETYAKLNSLIEQNNRSTVGKLLPNSPIIIIFDNAKKTLDKSFSI